MYKEYKEPKEKEKLLIKIATIFEQQGRMDEATKTYQKCTKMNSAEAFTKLGSLQIKLGKVA